MNYGLIGSETPIDDLLDQYFPGAPRNLLYEAFESETNALLAALLMEMRGTDVDQDVTGDSEAVYYSEAGIGVNEIAEKEVSWDFSADSVTVYGFDQPLAIAFKSPNKGDRLIKLSPEEAPFTVAPPDGLGASTVWYRKQTESQTATSFNVLALK